MIIIPAIDLLNGNCVRLVKGDYGSAGKVAADPLETILQFVEAGAEYIHIVDLDGAKVSKPVNNELILSLAEKCDVPIEVGGGIRTYETVEYYINNGISRVILGSAALRHPELVYKAVSAFGDKIAVGIDAQNGMVKTSGWLENSDVNYTELAVKMADCGVECIIFTDIDRDGTLSGPNLEQLGQLKTVLNGKAKLTASGGVRDMNDIANLNKLNIYGAIAGKSIYAGTLNLSQAIGYTKGAQKC